MSNRRIRYLRGALALLVLALVLAAYLVDRHLKAWPGTGFTLTDSLNAGSSNLPALWEHLLQTDAGAGVSKALSREIADLERDVRIATGIRPTPARWSLWLGERMVYSQRDTYKLLCLRPGVLLRAALALGVAPKGNDALPIDYAWHEGYLLVSLGQRETAPLAPATEVPAAAFDAPDLYVRLPEPGGAISMHLLAVEDLPVILSGPSLEGPAPSAAARMSLPDDADKALVDVFVDSRGRGVLKALRRAAEHFNLLPAVDFSLEPPVPAPLTASLPWERIALEHWTLFDVQPDHGKAILHLGHSLCLKDQAWGRHPYEIDAVYPPISRIPYEWDTVPGFLLPILGRDYTFGCANQGAWAHMANPPEYLPELLVQSGAHTDVPPAFRIRVNWDRVAAAYGAWHRALRVDVPESTSVFDQERTLSTRVDALRALGETLLEMHLAGDDGVWRVSGQLARGAG